MEGDVITLGDYYIGTGFNSRPRVEGDLRTLWDTIDEKIVSIHALAWRATICPCVHIIGTICFNSRPRVEGDSSQSRYFAGFCWFQFTPSRGGRLESEQKIEPPFEVSIHALAWRATLLFCPCVNQTSGFNSRPRVEGDTIGGGATGASLEVSIHALAWRATKEVTT